jgi:hypothetical protein
MLRGRKRQRERGSGRNVKRDESKKEALRKRALERDC